MHMCMPLHTPREYLVHLKRTLRKSDRANLTSEGVVRRYSDATGSRRVQGGPRLKVTQTYTAEFGEAVAHLHRKRVLADFLGQSARKALGRDMPELALDALPVWEDAKLEPVNRYIKRRRLRAAGAASL